MHNSPLHAPAHVGLLSPDEEANALDQLFGPSPSRSTDRELIAKDVADEVRRMGGEVVNVVSRPDGVLIVGFTESKTLCQLLVCHSSKPPRSLSTSIYVVQSLPELRGHLQSL